MLKEAQYIWKDGKLVPWAEATTHILTHTLHYGNAVFEGTRAYMTPEGLAIFRLQDHTKRLLNSAKIVCIKSPYTQTELENAQIELLRANKDDYKANVYIRPLIYLGYGVMGLYHANAPVNVAIAAWEWGAYLGDDALKYGIKVKTSSFVRNCAKSHMGKAKSAGGYLNSQMAKYEAISAGCEEALLLDDNGFIAEGSGECFFIVRDGVLITPPHDNSLESITQATVVELAKDLGIPLAAIKEAVASINTPSFLSLLENEEASIIGKIRECNARLGIVKAIKSSINEASKAEKEKLYKDILYNNVTWRDSRIFIFILTGNLVWNNILGL